jgi:NADH-quinone oxidoreductase subunit H
MAFAVFFLAEYANMFLVTMLAALMFLGGWLSPVPFLPDSFLWFRATFPRYRYDQIMRLGWKVFIPITIVWIVFVGGMMQTPWAYLFH